MKKIYEIDITRGYIYPNLIKKGCTEDAMAECETVAKFDSFDEAEKEFSKYSSDSAENYSELGKPLVTEYFLAEITLDEDGDEIDFKILKYSDGLED